MEETKEWKMEIIVIGGRKESEVSRKWRTKEAI